MLCDAVVGKAALSGLVKTASIRIAVQYAPVVLRVAKLMNSVLEDMQRLAFVVNLLLEARRIVELGSYNLECTCHINYPMFQSEMITK